MSPSCFTKHLNNSCFDSDDASRITCRIPEGTFKPDLKLNHRKKVICFLRRSAFTELNSNNRRSKITKRLIIRSGQIIMELNYRSAELKGVVFLLCLDKTKRDKIKKKNI